MVVREALEQLPSDNWLGVFTCGVRLWRPTLGTVFDFQGCSIAQIRGPDNGDRSRMFASPVYAPK